MLEHNEYMIQYDIIRTPYIIVAYYSHIAYHIALQA